MFPQHWPGCQWSSPWCRPRLWRARRGSSPQSRVWSCRPRSWPCSGCTCRCPPHCRCWDNLKYQMLSNASKLFLMFSLFFHKLSQVYLGQQCSRKSHYSSFLHRLQQLTKTLEVLVICICTWVHNVGEIELEVVAGTVTDIDGAAGAKALGAGAEYGAPSGVTLWPAQTHALYRESLL